MNKPLFIVACVCVASVISCTPQQPAPKVQGTSKPPHTATPMPTANPTANSKTISHIQSSGTFKHAAVAADHPLASQAGAEMLRAGGNAVDAAVAASFALSVVRPYSCGIGGGGFMVIKLPVHPKDPSRGPVLTTINYREWGIGKTRPDYFENDPDKDAPTHGGKAVCVPGTVAGLLYALNNYGTMDRARVLAPAIRIAEEGFQVDQHYEDSSHKDELVIPWLNQDAARQQRFSFLWERFLDSGRVKVGYTLKLPEQAKALRLISEHGADGFYKGPVADAMIKAIKADGGEMTHEDLTSYKVEERAPLRATFKNHVIYTMPPPSSGGIVLAQVLGMLESREQDLQRVSNADLGHGHNSAEYIHFITETFKHSFADRARWMADPNFIDVPVKALTDPAYLTQTSARINLNQTQPNDSYGTSKQLPGDHGTSHLCAVDAQGGAVACTETINLIFGSLLPVPEFGFILNNEMDDFVTREGQANAFGLSHAALNSPEPRKRPLSSMTPTIVERDGKPFLLVGGAGGPRIITGSIQATLNVLLFDMNANDALSKPRFHHQWQPDTLQMESALLTNQALVSGLNAKGHATGLRASIASVQLIRVSPEGWQAGSDPRKGGSPAGY